MKLFLVSVLFLGISQAAFSDAPIVPPPPPELGSLKLNGEPGVGQPKNVEIWKCGESSKFVAAYASCAPLKGTYPLSGATIALAEGVYRISLGQISIQGVRIQKGIVTTITMPQMQIPKSGTAKFRVFRDFTDPEEQEKMLTAIWTNSALEKKGGHAQVYCGYNCSQKYCKAVRSSPLAMKDVLWRFTSKAEVQYFEVVIGSETTGGEYGSTSYYINSEEWQLPERYYVNAMSDTGNSVALFPGAYGIEYYDAAENVTSTFYGMVVK